MTKHPNYEFIVAFAEGEEVQFQYAKGGNWFRVTYLSEIEENSIFRIKPKTRMINGFEVPCAMDKKPEHGVVYYYPDVSDIDFYGNARFNSAWDNLQFSRGLCFLNKEDAIAVAKAMLGIDPYKPDQ